MKDVLSQTLKKYVEIFLKEYSKYLDNNQIDLLKRINYDNIFSYMDIPLPFGITSFGRIYLSNQVENLLNSLKKMPNYNIKRENLHNKNISSYLKYICENGYNIEDFYQDFLMYYIFFMVVDSRFLNKGFINQEIKYLSIKYSIRCANLYAKEESLISKITFLSNETCRKILFMDSVNAYKYINDNYGFKYAEFLLDLEKTVKDESLNIWQNDYPGVNGFLNYADSYDKISYADAYDEILDFRVNNNLL